MTQMTKGTKVIIITGASSGIGKEIALLYAKNPSHRFSYFFSSTTSNLLTIHFSNQIRLVLAARTFSKLEEVRHECEKKGCKAISIKTDVSIENECK